MALQLKPLLDLIPLDEESDNSDYTPQRPITGATGTWEEAPTIQFGDQRIPIPDQINRPPMPREVSDRAGLPPEQTNLQAFRESVPSVGDFASDLMRPTGLEEAGRQATILTTSTPEDLQARATAAPERRAMLEQSGMTPGAERPFMGEQSATGALAPARILPPAPEVPEGDVADTAFKNELAKSFEELTSGENQAIMLATMGAGMLPRVGQYLQKAVSGYFGAEGAVAVVEGANKLREAATPAEKAQAWAGIIKGAAIAVPAAMHAVSPIRPAELPRPAVEAIASGHEKGLTKAAEAATESIAKDVVAKEVEAAKVEGAPVPDAVAEKAAPAPEITTESVAAMTPEEFGVEARTGSLRGFSAKADELGRQVTTPEEITRLKEHEAKAQQDFMSALDAEDAEAASVLSAKKQFFTEAIEAAVGVPASAEGKATWSKERIAKAKADGIPANKSAPETPIEKGAQNGQEEITQEKDNALLESTPLDPQSGAPIAPKTESVGIGNKSVVEPEPISVGPGAASPGDFPKGSQLSQLTDMLKTQKPLPQASVLGRIEAFKRLSDSWAKGKDAVTAGLGKLKAVAQSLTDTYKNLPKWDSYEDAVGKWSGADNASGVEVRNFQKAIHKTIPSRLRQEAITNWIQADGDAAVLKERAAASKPDLRRGYEEALKLTPDEQVFARQIQQYLDSRLQEGVESGLIKNGVENYVTQVWQKENPTTRKLQTDLFGGGNLNPDFKYARKRVFDSYFEGEQAGFAPKDKGIGSLIAHYDTAFNRALSSRSFIKALHDGKAPNGEPIVAVSGKTVPVPKGSEVAEAFLIKPRANDAVTKDGRPYRVIDHWALRDWKWSTTGPDGQPVLVQGDLLVHPDYAGNLKNVLGKSALTSREGIASVTTRPLLQASALAKQTKLSLSAFHLTQEGIHGLFHRVNPANIVELDVNAPAQRALMDHGLQVADPRAAELFGEGLAGGGLVGKIPGLGKVQVVFNDWLFKDYIPRLKMTMALDALERNRHAYAKEIKSGKITDDQLQALTSREANAAFGELNYRMMGRNPTVQDFLRLSFLAPDFLEARARFVGQALKPYGREQQLALGFMGAALYVTGRVLNQYLDDKPHWDKPFSVMHNGREYRLRTVLGDVQHLWDDPRRFIYNRLSPAARTIVEGVTSKDDRGINRNFLEQAKDVASWFIPIPVQVRSDETVGEAIGSSVGAGSRKYTARTQLYELADKWKKSNPDPHIQEQYEQARKETRADSPYKTLRDYVEKGDAKAVQEEFNKLLKAHTDKQIFEAFKPKPFTGSKASDRAFYDSLSAEDKKLFERAQEEQDSLRGKLGDMIR